MIQEPTKPSRVKNGCHGQSVSWLKLERYHIGELRAEDQREIASHLSECPLCNQKYQQIITDDRPLRQLEIKTVSETSSSFRFALMWGLGVTATVAALLFVVVRTNPDAPPTFPGSKISYKGGDTVVTLAREREGRVIYDPQTYRNDDRFRLFLTSPEVGLLPVEVVVFQGCDVYFPYPDRLEIPSGNRVPIAGALRLTGNEKTRVCILLGPDLPSRDLIKSMVRKTVSRNTVCYQLDPEYNY